MELRPFLLHRTNLITSFSPTAKLSSVKVLFRLHHSGRTNLSVKSETRSEAAKICNQNHLRNQGREKCMRLEKLGFNITSNPFLVALSILDMICDLYLIFVHYFLGLHLAWSTVIDFSSPEEKPVMRTMFDRSPTFPTSQSARYFLVALHRDLALHCLQTTLSSISPAG